jgi:acetyl-CoA carboxylase biotin carboxylase subunit
MVPGTDQPIQSVEEAHQIAEITGYPLLVKASAGGGGKGMRVVEVPEQLEEGIRLAQSEAASAFGNDDVFMERYVANPKHIEIQILADDHGNCVYLFERECSVQRRHQKLIEEAPSSCLTPAVRQAMGESAVAVAKACNYSGAGTVEFLVDNALNYYFLEMNTRLQVEHCVTEEITGLDLVQEQIRIAEGHPLPFKQEDLTIRGHAIELRVCAEDPANNFLPDTGTLERYQTPKGPGVRVDDGYEEGAQIPIYYDPMIAKLIAWGATREQAIDRLLRAIEEYQIQGIQTTLPFGSWALQQPAFRDGQFDTGFIPKYFAPEKLYDAAADEPEIAALLAAHVWGQPPVATAAVPPQTESRSGWAQRRKTGQW